MTEVLNLALLFTVYTVLCLSIVAACVCRINAMTSKRNKLAWWLMYAGMAVYAAGELIDVALSWHWLPTHELVGLVAIALNLALTQRHWRDGPPPITCKSCP